MKRTFSNDIGTEKDVDRALFNVACIVAHRMLDAVVERNNLIVGTACDECPGRVRLDLFEYGKLSKI